MQIESGGALRRALHRFGDRTAVSAPQGSLSFLQLNAQANAVGASLARLGLSAGDRVGVLSHNRLEVVPTWLAIEKRAMVRVVLHSHFDMTVHVASLEQVGATALVFDVRFAAEVDKHRAQMKQVKHFIALGDGAPTWATPYAELQRGEQHDVAVDVEEDAACFVQFTTGTTGRPKPWVATHRSWQAVIANNLDHLDSMRPGQPAIGPDDVNLHFHALQWASGFQTLYPYLLRGARTVLVDDAQFDPAAAVDALVREQATGVLVPAPMFGPMLEIIEQRGGVAHSLRRVVIFFATPELLRRVEKALGPVWCHGFGSTEQGAPTTRLTAADVAQDPRRIDSVGRGASSFFEVAVVDGAGKPEVRGRPGEIVVRSAMSTSRYWNDGSAETDIEMQAKTRDSFFAHDWFRTGDVGYLDDEGFLFYLDRDKDKILAVAGTVYPHVVEARLLTHAAVANCGVVGLGQTGRQSVVAGVLLKPDTPRSAALADAILKSVESALQSHERPTRLVFVDELPTVLGGAKVQREVLARQLSAMGAQS
jgi:acyl-coenzyme A synthetase/AMP-(fatty) acid ligase